MVSLLQKFQSMPTLNQDIINLIKVPDMQHRIELTNGSLLPIDCDVEENETRGTLLNLVLEGEPTTFITNIRATSTLISASKPALDQSFLLAALKALRKE